MAGVKGMHARQSTSPTYAAKVRARIKAGGIVFCLHEHIVGKREMTSSQVTAALGLLRKVVPDKSEADITLNRVESLQEEQARLMAESYIESSRRTALGAPRADPVHVSVPSGLPPG